jgi:N-hydroxyarylamine O-acetyltransferase
MWSAPEGVVTPRGHMLLLVTLNEEIYVCDVGFGGLTLTAPLLFLTNIEQETPHETFRFIASDEEYILQVKLQDGWKAIYRFGLQEQLLPDYEVSNWYLSNHPNSHFLSSLIVARAGKNVRYTLRNNELAKHNLAGITERESFTSVAALKTALENVFGIKLPSTPELDPALERVILPTAKS